MLDAKIQSGSFNILVPNGVDEIPGAVFECSSMRPGVNVVDAAERAAKGQPADDVFSFFIPTFLARQLAEQLVQVADWAEKRQK